MTRSDHDNAEWPDTFKRKYAGTWFFHFDLCVRKHATLLLRDKEFMLGQVLSAIITGEDRIFSIPRL